MSAVYTAVVVSIVSAGASASQSHQQKKASKHAKERGRGRENELKDAADAATALSKKTDRANTAKRAAGYARNLNVFGGSSSGMAERARKTLTGQ